MLLPLSRVVIRDEGERMGFCLLNLLMLFGDKLVLEGSLSIFVLPKELRMVSPYVQGNHIFLAPQLFRALIPVVLGVSELSIVMAYVSEG